MSEQHRTPQATGTWRWIGHAGLLASGTLATLVGNVALLRGEPGSLRSVKDVRPRIPDELDRPVRRETSSHRGWEIREDQFTIAANTSLEDARWAAAAVTKVRGQTAALADRFTSVHRNPDFGLNSLQVVIDGNPPRERDAPAVTMNVVGIQTQAVINVSPGQPRLADQLLRLREAAAFAVLHATELDGVLPQWTVAGMAAHIARQGQGDDARQQETPLPNVPEPNDFAPAGEPLGGQQWRSKRTAQDRLALPAVDRTAAASQVAFLLDGNDGAHAPEFLAGVAHTIESQRSRAAMAPLARRRGEVQPAPASGRAEPLARLLAESRSQYEAWLKDPEAGQPIYEPAAGTSSELQAAQREMLVLLKLQRRLASEDSSAVAVKVATFDREKGRQLAGSAGEREPPTPAAIAQRLRDPSRPAIATLDADGSLLLSSDRERINQLVGWDGQRYEQQRHENQWVLSTRLADGRVLRGHLADNPEKPNRPLAKFTIGDATASGVKPIPTALKSDAQLGDDAARAR